MYMCCVGEWSEPWLYSWHGNKDDRLHDVPKSERVTVSLSTCTHLCTARRTLCRIPAHVPGVSVPRL